MITLVTPTNAIDIQQFLSGAIGAAVITGVFGVILAVIAWIRGVRPDARAELELALTQQRETINRLSKSNEQQERLLDEERARGSMSARTLDLMQMEVAKTGIYLVRLEAYCDDLEMRLSAQGIILVGRPVRPPGTVSAV